jgi:hypothetical protein
MSARLSFLWLLGLSTCLMTGCSLHTSVLLRNESGQTVSVYSFHTKQTHVVNDGSSLDIPHTAGAVSITTKSGKVWKYSDVAIPSLDQEKCLMHGRKGLFEPSVTLRLLLQSDGSLYFLPPVSSQDTNYPALQPSGFPLHPVGATQRH